MKKDLFIKILKYLGVACLGAVVGMGALAGVSSCYSRNKNNNLDCVNTNIRHDRKITATTDILNSDSYFYFVAKNYANNGEGVFYQDTPSLDNSAICEQVGATFDTNEGITEFSFQLVDGTNVTKSVLRFGTALNGGVYKLRYVYMANADYSRQLYVYNTNPGVFNRNYCAFLGRGFKNSYGSDSNSLWYINQFFDIYSMSSSFEFSTHINYYAPYGQDIDNYYTNDANMTSASSFSLKVLLSDVPFYSGGYVFDKIQLRYQNAVATSYLDENGNRKVWGVNGFASYTMLEYVNTVTNFIYVVNDRIYQPWSEGSSSGFNVTKNSKWVSDYFRHITFFGDPTNTTITKLSILNNSSYQGGYIDETFNNNVGLNNAFDLLRLAFTSWLPILNISIVPGITLGLLLFLPLIVGIIILVIWLVKR